MHIPPGTCCQGSCRMAALRHFIMLHDHRSLRGDTGFHGIWAETYLHKRYRSHVSWWYSEISQYLVASLERFVCHFSQYGLTWMSNMNFLCRLTIVIPRLRWLFSTFKAVSWTVYLVESVTSDCVHSCNFVMWTTASKVLPIELVPCCDGWRKIDDKRHIWFQGCVSPPFRSANKIAM